MAKNHLVLAVSRLNMHTIEPYFARTLENNMGTEIGGC